jgi:hypothetical protein
LARLEMSAPAGRNCFRLPGQLTELLPIDTSQNLCRCPSISIEGRWQ